MSEEKRELDAGTGLKAEKGQFLKDIGEPRNRSQKESARGRMEGDRARAGKRKTRIEGKDRLSRGVWEVHYVSMTKRV